MKKDKRKHIENPLVTFDNPKSIISEKFRGIRSNIMFSEANEVSSIIVTSEKQDEGKSFISANIAITYAQAGYRTLLIDGDMRKPTQHYIFEESNYDGLSNLIIGKSNYEKSIRSTKVKNLDLLTSGPIPPNPSELIASKEFEKIYKELLNMYDFILIDTPPIMIVTDAQIFLQYTPRSIFVIDAEKNNKYEIKKAISLINKSKGHVLGVVLNKTPYDKSSNYYYYYGDNSK